MPRRNSELLIQSASRLFGAGAGTEIRLKLEGHSRALGVQEARGPFSGECRVVRGDGELVAVGTVNLQVSVPCRRCVEPVVDRKATSFDGRFVRFGSPKADAEMGEYDPEVFVLDQNGSIDLTELLRETVIASISPNVICQPDCAGLCPVCGSNLNVGDCGCEEYDVDPRWAPLKQLMEESLAQSEIDGD